jgi:hypothetical protein
MANPIYSGDSEYWTSQEEAQRIVVAEGCRICTWRTPGPICDVAGDLWCCLCAAEWQGQAPGVPAKLCDLVVKRIPGRVLLPWELPVAV